MKLTYSQIKKHWISILTFIFSLAILFGKGSAFFKMTVASGSHKYIGMTVTNGITLRIIVFLSTWLFLWGILRLIVSVLSRIIKATR